MGNTYYCVSSGVGVGSDTNPGSALLPWKTVQKCLNTIVAGDIVYGTGTDTLVTSNDANTNSGNLTDGHIKFIATDIAFTPTDGGWIWDGNNAVNPILKHYANIFMIWIEGVVFKRSTSYLLYHNTNVYVYGWVFKRCTFELATYAISIYLNAPVFEECIFDNLTEISNLRPGTSAQFIRCTLSNLTQGFDLFSIVYDYLIIDCIFKTITNYAILVGPSLYASLFITSNTFYDCGDGILVKSSTGFGVGIYWNRFVDCVDGIDVSDNGNIVFEDYNYFSHCTNPITEHADSKVISGGHSEINAGANTDGCVSKVSGNFNLLPTAAMRRVAANYYDATNKTHLTVGQSSPDYIMPSITGISNPLFTLLGGQRTVRGLGFSGTTPVVKLDSSGGPVCTVDSVIDDTEMLVTFPAQIANPRKVYVSSDFGTFLSDDNMLTYLAVPVLTAPIITARNINEAIIIGVIQTAKNNTAYKVYIKEGAGAYSRWPDASTTFLSNTISINTGISDSTQYTVKISSNASPNEEDSNEITLTTDFSYYANINKAFIDWIRYVTGYAAGKVIFDKQNMPKPARPYITIDLTSFIQPNMAYKSQVNDSGTSEILSDKEFTLHIHHFGTPSVSSINTLINLHESLDNIAAYKILQDAKIAFVNNLLGPTDTSPLRDKNTFEERASMDLLFRIPWRTLDTGTGVISSAEIEGTAKIEDQTVYNETVVVNP